MADVKHTQGPWTAMRKPPASFSDHGWRAMAMCGSEWMVAAPVSATRRVEGGVITKMLWDNEANARRIVQCVNTHDELVEALTNVLSRCIGLDPFTEQQARAALSKTGGNHG